MAQLTRSAGRSNRSVFKRCIATGALAAIALAGAAEAQVKMTPTAGGRAVYEAPADVAIQAENHIVTNVPGSFSGPSVNALVGADRFYAEGYSGANAVVANVEAGHVWSGHETLGHVSTFVDGANAPNAGWATPAYDRHATWVGQAIGGRGANNHQPGIAPDAELRSGAVAHEWNGSAYALSFSLFFSDLDVAYRTGATGFGNVDVINSSWGFTDSTGTDTLTLIIDGLANANPETTMVFSAGNSGSGTNTVGGPGSGYNSIAVGALQNDGSNNYDGIAGFSSRGPQAYSDPVNGEIADARAPVDISAPGTNLTLAFYGGQSGGNDAMLAGSNDISGANLYSIGVAGTSFAAPIVAGVATLMNDVADDPSAGMPASADDARVVKVNLLNAARKVPAWDNGQVDSGGVVTTGQGLDYTFGAGALDADAAFDQYTAGQTDIAGVAGGVSNEATGWDFATVPTTGTTQTDIVLPQTFLGGSEFTATLNWFRERTRLSSNSASDDAFADLDLEIWDSTFTTKFAESISFGNNVEHLHFELPTDTTIGLRTNFFGMNFGLQNTVDYALAWDGTLVPEPATLALALLGLAAILPRGRRRRAA